MKTKNNINKNYLMLLVILWTMVLGTPMFTQTNTFKVTPFGIEPTERQPVFIYSEIGESLTPDEWEPIGPNGFTGEAIAIDPQNANIIYAGGLSGLYKSIDGGINWELIGGSTLHPWVKSIAINPMNTHILLVWFRSNIYSNYEVKLMRSTDSGSTWTEVLTSSVIRASVIFDSQNTQRVFANADRVYISTDEGISWTSTGLSASTLAMYAQKPDILFATSFTELYKTTNGGQNWNLQNPQLPEHFSSLELSPTNSEILFGDRESFDGGFYRSTDGGLSWTQLTSGFGQSKSITVIAIDPGNTNIIYTGGWATGLYRSTNMGDQWTLISGSIQDNYIEALATTSNSNIYCVFGGSIYYSMDQGSSWQSLVGNLQNIDVFKVVSHPTNPNIVFASSFGGVYRTSDGGMNWQQINNGLLNTDVFALTIDPINPNIRYAGTFGGLI